MAILRLLSHFPKKAFKKVFKGGKVAILSSKITRFFPEKHPIVSNILHIFANTILLGKVNRVLN